LASGRTVSQLAEQSGYSERAMFRLLRKVYVRMQVRNRTEALLRARQQGWLWRELVVMAILGLPGGGPGEVGLEDRARGCTAPAPSQNTGSAAGTGQVELVAQ
jgi:hypothetical protein